MGPSASTLCLIELVLPPSQSLELGLAWFGLIVLRFLVRRPPFWSLPASNEVQEFVFERWAAVNGSCLCFRLADGAYSWNGKSGPMPGCFVFRAHRFGSTQSMRRSKLRSVL